MAVRTSSLAGRPQTPEHIAKRRASMEKHYGDPEWRARVGRAQLGNTSGRMNRGRVHSPEKRRRMGAASHRSGAKTKQFKPTKIELAIQEFMNALGVEYAVHKTFVVDGRKFVPDIYVPSEDLIIEVNGCYWHVCQECNQVGRIDQRIKDEEKIQLLERDHQVLVIWEHDIDAFATRPGLIGLFEDAR